MKIAPLLLILACPVSALAADSPTGGEGLAAVQEMGRVNGLALACQQPALSTRARNAIVTGAPKTRGIGEAFESATSASFIAQGKGGVCPDAATLRQQVEAAEARLQAAFAPAK